jgi:hypothetical protein
MEFVDSLDVEVGTLEVHKIDVERKGCRTLYAYVRIKATGQPYDPTGKVADGRHDLAYVTTKLGFDKDGDPIGLVALNEASTSKQAQNKKRKQAPLNTRVAQQKKRAKTTTTATSSRSSRNSRSSRSSRSSSRRSRN